MGGCAARPAPEGTKPLVAGMVGGDPKMLELYASIRELAAAEVPVLIQGESGTGKELVATAIHRGSHRAAKRFVAINCGAIPDSLVESDLFGHVKGAFTGAHRDRMGRFELADGGTILLDEVGDLSHAAQVKLFRVVQDGTFEKVGAEKQSRVDVRVISATNKDLRREVAANRFREDLYYRLSVVPLSVPPLRERLADIPLLVEHILDEESRRSDRRQDPARPPRRVTVARETIALFLAHQWPGNIRELQNVVRYALIKCKEELLRPEHLPPFYAVPGPGSFKFKGRKPKSDKRPSGGGASPHRDVLPAVYEHACRSQSGFEILEQRHIVDQPLFELETIDVMAKQARQLGGMILVPPANLPTDRGFAGLKNPQER